MDLVRYFEQQQIKETDRPAIQAGDSVRVETKVKEGDKERLQGFEGTVIGVRGSGPSITFTVRREVGRFAVERIFPLYSPIITKIDIVKRQKVRRAKLNYLRTSGRRRVKEDERAMQRYVHAEEEKARLAEEARRREEEKQRKEEEAARRAADKAKREAEEKAQAETTAKEEPKTEASKTKPEENKE